MGYIYFIKCLTSNRVYVGSTSKSFLHRWRQHINDLLSNRHENKKLQRTYNKYKTLVAGEVENVDDSNLLLREQFYIDSLKSSGFDLFNLCPVAGTIKGFKWSDESKQKRCGSGNPMFGKGYTRIGDKNPMFNKPVTNETRRKLSVSGKGRIRNDIKELLSIPVFQYSKDGRFLNKFTSMVDASKCTQAMVCHISSVCKGKRKSAGGFVWKLQSD